MSTIQSVFVVHHSYGDSESETYKLVGIFSSETLALKAVEVLRQRSGFHDYPEGFSVDNYKLNEICWAEGFGPNDLQTVLDR